MRIFCSKQKVEKYNFEEVSCQDIITCYHVTVYLLSCDSLPVVVDFVVYFVNV